MELADLPHERHEREVLVEIPLGGSNVVLEGTLAIPDGAVGTVIFVGSTGARRRSPRQRFIAKALREDAQVATLLVDLLSPREDAHDAGTASLRFDVVFLARRLREVSFWVLGQRPLAGLPLGYFAASTGAAAALVAAAHLPDNVGAVVVRGGRPDLAGEALGHVRAPTLLVVGGDDLGILDRNREAKGHLRGVCALEVVPHASHLFEEPGALGIVTKRAARWFARHLRPHPASGAWSALSGPWDGPTGTASG